MKRLAKRTIVIAAVLTVLAIMVSAAAYGYFISGRTISNNQVSTGSIELKVNDGGAALPVTLSGLMPGNSGTAANYKITNAGDTAATFYVGVHGNDVAGFDDGLAQALKVAYWLDADNSGTWTVGDSHFVPDSTYQPFAAGDTLAVPARAYYPLSEWNEAWSNTLNVPGAADAGYLRMTYSLPASVDNLTLMGKSCNFDLTVELHQYHDDTGVLTISHVSGHSGAAWSAIANGVLVDQGTVGTDGYLMTLPVNTYDIVFTQGAWTYTKHITVTTAGGAFDLAA